MHLVLKLALVQDPQRDVAVSRHSRQADDSLHVMALGFPLTPLQRY